MSEERRRCSECGYHEDNGGVCPEGTAKVLWRGCGCFRPRILRVLRVALCAPRRGEFARIGCTSREKTETGVHVCLRDFHLTRQCPPPADCPHKVIVEVTV